MLKRFVLWLLKVDSCEDCRFFWIYGNPTKTADGCMGFCELEKREQHKNNWCKTGMK